MGQIGELWIKIGAKIDDFEKGMSDVDKAMKKVGERMAKAGKALTLGITLPLAAAGGAAVKMAIDAVESENLFEVTFGKMAKTVRKWSREISQALGMNQYEVRETVGVFFDMLKSMGMTESQAAEMAKQMTMLGYDIASFRNIRPEEAFEKLRSSIVGMPRPMQDLGYVINETTVKNWALTNGIIKQGEELTTAQKVWGRYNVMMEVTKTAQGDLARTLDSPANKIRVLKSRVTELAIEFGYILLPRVDKVLSALQKFAEHASKSSTETKEMVVKIGGLAAAIGPVLWGFGILVSKVLPMVKKGFTALTGPIGATVTLIAVLAERINAFIKIYKKTMSLYRQEEDLTGRKSSWLAKTLSGLDIAWRKLSTGVDLNKVGLKAYNELQIGARRRADALLGGIKFLNSGLQFLATGFKKLGKEVATTTGEWQKFLKEKDILTIEETNKRISRLETVLEELEEAYKSGAISQSAYREATKDAREELAQLRGESITIAEVVETKLYPSMRKLGSITYDVLVKWGNYTRGVKEEVINLSAIFPEKLQPTVIDVYEVIENQTTKLQEHTYKETNKIKKVWLDISEEIKAVWVRELSAIVFEAKSVADGIINAFKSMSRILLDVVFKHLVDNLIAIMKGVKNVVIDTSLVMQAGFWSFAAFVSSKLVPHVLNAFDALFSAIAGRAEYTGDVISKEMLSGFGVGEAQKTRGGPTLEEILELLNKIPEALKTLIKNVDKSAERLTALGRVGKLTFQAMVASGATFMEALNALKGPLETLRDKYEKLGKDVPKFLEPWVKMIDLMELKPKIFENLDAAITILNSLKDTGWLTADAFKTLQVSANAFAKSILGVGGNLNIVIKGLQLTKDQIGALLPVVAQFVSAAAVFGLPVPAWMRTFVTEKLGVDWNEFVKKVSDPAKQTNEILDKSYTRLGKIWNSLENHLPKIKAALQGMTRFQNEGIAWKSQLAMVGEPGPEAIVDLVKLAQGQSKFSGGFGSPSITFNYSPQITAMDAQDVYRFMTTKGREAIEQMLRANVRGITREMKKQIGQY